MVLPLLTLPAELQALFVVLLADAATAGRLAQASHACKALLQQRLVALHEEHRLAAQARMYAIRNRKRIAVMKLFEKVDGGALHRCKSHNVAFGTPCGRLLRVPRSGSLQVLMKHLQQFHAAEYSALMQQM